MSKTRSIALTIIWVLISLAGLACRPKPSEIRFARQPIVWRVNDNDDVPTAPRTRRFVMSPYRVESFTQATEGLLSVRGRPTARDINALGEVPDSSWFTNRIGVRAMTDDEVFRGPRTQLSPDEHKPWTITATKVGGLAPGLQFTDARGYRYLLKFDRKGRPDLDTGTDIVVQRLLHAFGYNVPENDIVVFNRNELILAPDAEVKDLFGNKHPLTRAELNEILDGIDQLGHGRIRGLASKYLDGRPIGGYPRLGVRRDDPNDTIPHEHRRSIRAQRTVFGWVGHTDVKEDNTLDMWITRGQRHYVKHYLLDFGNALGAWAKAYPLPWSGFKHSIDLAYGLPSLLTFGLWLRPWERIPDSDPDLQGIGWFESELFNPASFQSNQHYAPLDYADRFDSFWAAKIMMRFTDSNIEAAVRAARYQPASAAYLVETLIARKRKTAHHWFLKVAPLDNFTKRQGPTTAASLCFDDLWLTYGFGEPKATTYRIESFTRAGRSTGRVRRQAKSSTTCAELPTAARGYVIERIWVEREQASHWVEVHLDLASNHPVIGVVRG